MADPTRPRTGPRGPHADGEASLARITTYCGEGLPSQIEDTVPLHMRGRAPIITDGAGKIHNDTIMSSLWRACHSSSRRFLSPLHRDIESSEWFPSPRRDRTLPSHRRGFWPQCDTIPHCGTDLENVPIIVHPLLSWWSRSLGPSAKLPQTEGNVPTAHNVTIPIVILLHLVIFHGSLPIGVDDDGKRELASNSTKWRRRWTQSTPRNSKSGLNPI